MAHVNMPKHTGGKWVLSDDGDKVYTERDARGYRDLIAVAHRSDLASRDGVESAKTQAAANAKLIAATPEAYAILSLLADWAHNGAETISLSSLMADNGPTLREAIKAYEAKVGGL